MMERERGAAQDGRSRILRVPAQKAERRPKSGHRTKKEGEEKKRKGPERVWSRSQNVNQGAARGLANKGTGLTLSNWRDSEQLRYLARPAAGPTPTTNTGGAWGDQ